MRAKTFIIIGIFLSLFTISLLYFYLKTIDKEDIVPQVTKSEIRREVVFAKQTIPIHTIIDSTMVYTKPIKETEVPREALQGLGSVVGSMAQTTIEKDSPILSHQVSFKIRLAYKVPKGKRAVTLVVDKGEAVSYLVKPGDLVDVVGKFDKDFAGEELGKTIIQLAEVLAIGQQYMPRVSKGENKKGEKGEEEEEEISFETVTLAVPLEDVERLVLGINKSAQIKLALRNPKEVMEVVTRGANRYSLLGRAIYEPKPKVKVKPKPAPPKIIPEPEPKEELKKIEIYRRVSKEIVEMR
ncbi:MAG: Flp pilus assembly protein CpaB [bacterium]|nr:Flp pilus assembly protein CpaB [bacterium]